MDKYFKKTSGFTLLELMFVMLFIVIFARLTVPRVNAMLRGNLRSSATKLSGFFKAAHDRSIMRSEHIRIYFDLENNTYWASVYIEPQPEAMIDSSTNLDEAIMAFEKLAEDGIGDSEPKSPEIIYEKLNDRNLKKSQLSKGIRVKRIYKASVGNSEALDNNDSNENDMLIYLDFFPNGFSTQSIVYIENAFDDVYSIVIPPIGGQSKTEKGEINAGF